MIKKLISAISVVLAVNFLAVAGGVGWLYKSGALTREKLPALKEVLFPKPPEAPATQPAAPASQPTMRLEELLAQATGRTTTEQVEFIKDSFEAQLAILDRRQRELVDLQRQVELSKQQLSKDRTSLDTQIREAGDRDKRAAALAGDKGFQDSLTLYNTMTASQVKRVFSTLDDVTVTNYLQAMQPRTAAKIIKEFKSPEETERIQRILERMRLASAVPKE